MKQLSVKEMYDYLEKEIEKGNGDKLLITANDTEGNGYHGVFFKPCPAVDYKGVIEITGLQDSEEDLEKLMIIG